MRTLFLFTSALLIFMACRSNTSFSNKALEPDYITDTVLVDTDDPAIWINSKDAMKSLILGTDKGDSTGGIYAFDLYGKIQKKILGLPRPNNIDVEYGFVFNGDTIDIAVFTQRNADNIRVIRLPDLEFIDNGGIDVFKGDSIQSPMGIGLYKRPSTREVYAFVGRKSGPNGSYVWQYHLIDSSGVVIAKPVRKFGSFRGGKEIESIAVDDEAGFIYYADEGAGVRKYYADPDSLGYEITVFASEDFEEDHEGISIYQTGPLTGYILVSDQKANRFHVFPRDGSGDYQQAHERVAIIPLSTNNSDGSDVTHVKIGNLYPKGFFVAMSDDRTFQIYNWEKIEKAILATK